MTRVRWFSIFAMALAILIGGLTATPSSAQMPLPSSGQEESGPVLPEELSREAIRDVLSQISDAEARELLIQELDKQAAAREAELAARDARSVMEVFQDWGAALGWSWYQTISSIPITPGAVADAAGIFMERRGDRPLWQFFTGLLIAMGGGLFAAWAVGRLVRNWANRAWDARPEGLGAVVRLLAVRFLLQSTTLIAFLAAAYALNPNYSPVICFRVAGMV